MKLALHQLRTDFRSHRVAVVIALTLGLFGPAVGLFLGDRLPGGFADLARIGVALAIVLAGTLAVTAGLRETPLVGDRRFWPTRPLPVRSVFLARGIWLLVLFGAIAVGSCWARSQLHLNPSQLAVTTFLSAGWMSLLILAVNNLRSVSADRRTFFGHLSLAVAGFFVSFFVASVGLRAAHRGGGPESFLTSFTIAIGITIFLLLVAWFLVGRFRNAVASRRLSLVAIGFMPWLLSGLLLPKQEADPVAVATPSFTLVEPDEVRAGEVPPGQLLWENLVVGGLEPGQFFVSTQVSTVITRSQESETAEQSETARMPTSLLRHRVGDRQMWNAVRARFPDDIVWSVPEKHRGDIFLSLGSLSPGDLELTISGVVHQMLPLATIDLAKRSDAPMAGGGRISIGDLSTRSGRLGFNVQAVYPESEIHDLPRILEWYDHAPFRDNLWCVFLDREAKAAVGVDPDPRRSRRDDYALGLRLEAFDFEVPLSEQWLERFRMSSGEWPEGLELRVFTQRPVAIVPSQTLGRDDYNPEPSLPERHHRELVDFAAASLPASASREQIGRFLDSVIFSGPDDRGDSPYLPKFRQLHGEGLLLLMSRLPLPDDSDRAARTVLSERAEDIDPQACLEALRRDPLFVELCLKKGLEAEAANILRPLLDKRRPLPPDVAPAILRLGVEQLPLDDDLVDDLLWHYLRAGWRQYQATSFLVGLPGFDATVAEAWERFPVERNNHGQRELAPYALRLGNKEALRLTLLKLRGRLPDWERERTLGLLTKHLGTWKSAEEAVAWAERHFEDLRFDRETGRFSLP